ncbi:hypothetical protein J4T96_gp125 [Mycobacterium phage Finemlucis]|uniref:Uncharacterized protein n=1 Tax=Mycobacterium phage Finemlucis TaxID=2015844 RepID=A0A291I9Z5_9CAUD|nr:hypothetical protein J4T96_gp125 [Mycobacterium phage Finemlucis]ATG86523.1 hypothetical protein SEA_FINEMLUCIS_121 [Mycobacterium phage Finemlucis]
MPRPNGQFLITLVCTMDLDKWIEDFKLVGPLTAKTFIRELAAEAVQHEIEKHGHTATVTIKRQ